MISAPNAILNALSAEHRRVLSRWRALIYLRRASNQYNSDERRWNRVPRSPEDMLPTLRRMQNSGVIESLERAPGCYAVATPYAQNLPIREDELLLEINPYAVLTHYTALVFHGFTLNRPNVITAWPGQRDWAIPIGTEEEEWNGLDLPVIHRPTHVLAQEVQWFGQYSDFSFGVTTDYSGPVLVRITDRERTLIDSLQWPSFAGGIGNVIQAWEMAQSFVNINSVVEHVENYGINLLRQRVGFVAELVGFTHPEFDTWASHSTRGGSSRLVSSRPFGPNINSRWNMSINAPVEAFLS